MDFYTQLENYKKSHRLTNEQIGAVVDKKPEAFRIALKRKSLSKLEIDLLEKHFKLDRQESKQNFEEIQVADHFEHEFLENGNANFFQKLPGGKYYMLMPLASHNIQAGLLDNYQDIEMLKGMDQHGIIVDRPAKGRYLAFVVKGDSMDDGTSDAIPHDYIVATRELQRQHWRNKLRYKDFRFWVIYTTESKYPLLKEITNHDIENGTISCHSLNDSPEYQDFDLSLNDVRALFYVISITRPVSGKEIY